MSVWIIHQDIAEGDEENIRTREFVLLPFGELPDLSHVTNLAQCRELLQKINPGKPPESIMLAADRIWNHFSAISTDDIVAVPLEGLKSVALARVCGGYKYRVGEGGKDEHMLPVSWYEDLIPISVFGRFKSVFTSGRMVEVTDRETRIKILDQLPHKYNRFAGWKWILVIFFILGALNFIIGMLRQTQ